MFYKLFHGSWLKDNNKDLRHLYLPEVLHSRQGSERGWVPRRQWRVQEQLRHDFGVIVHVSTNHPIGHCKGKNNIRNISTSCFTTKTWMNVQNKYI